MKLTATSSLKVLQTRFLGCSITLASSTSGFLLLRSKTQYHKCYLWPGGLIHTMRYTVPSVHIPDAFPVRLCHGVPMALQMPAVCAPSIALVHGWHCSFGLANARFFISVPREPELEWVRLESRATLPARSLMQISPKPMPTYALARQDTIGFLMILLLRPRRLYFPSLHIYPSGLSKTSGRLTAFSLESGTPYPVNRPFAT